jgi:surfeit locus 1 family protein
MSARRRNLGLLACLLVVVAGSALGRWQVSRGQDRQQYLDALVAQPPQAERGIYLASRQLLLDGQSHAGVPGYHAWTPLQLATGELLVVDRGWVPQPAPALPAPVGEVGVTGRWRPLPRAALRLRAAVACPAASFPAVVEYPSAAELRCLLGASVRDGVLQLDPAVPGGFVRDWGEAGFPPARHYAYAAQWFGLALVGLVFFVRELRKPQ